MKELEVSVHAEYLPTKTKRPWSDRTDAVLRYAIAVPIGGGVAILVCRGLVALILSL